MTDFEFRVQAENPDLMDKYAVLLERFPALIPRFVQSIAERHEANLLSIVKITPGEPVSPWPWVSRRQEQAFFLTNGFGGGIPHERGGAGSIEESWKVEVTVLDDTTSEIVVDNTAMNIEGRYYSDFVMGWESQPGFIATGWLQIPDIFELMADERDSMFQDFILLADDALTNWREAD